MSSLVGFQELIAHPAVLPFTGMLVFSVLWTAISLVLPGDDGDEGDSGEDGDAGPSLLHPGGLPTSIGLMLFSFPAWALSMLAVAVSRSLTVTAVVASGTIAVGVLGGVLMGYFLVRSVGKPLGRLLNTETAPSNSDTVGSICKVRAPIPHHGFGDAEVISGPTKGSLIRVEADGEFSRGELGLVLSIDENTGRYWITELDSELRPT